MNTEQKKFLLKLLTTPSPTGFEQKIQRVVKNRMKDYADTIETDLHGNLIVGINTQAKKKVMLAGHCDQIGFMVKHITKDGFIYLLTLGGIDLGTLPGSRVTVLTEKERIPGILGRKPIHLQKPVERKKGVEDIDEIWLDIGAKNKKEAEKRVTIGDAVIFDPVITEMGTDYICGPGIDDRVGLFVAMEALRLCSRGKLDVALYAVSTVQEEIGTRGAMTATNRIEPEVGIAIDVTHASDNPGQTDSKATPCELGKGPTVTRGPNTNSIVEKRLVQAAKEKKIPFQPEPFARLHGNDSRAMQVSGRGVATACIGIPNRYMHTQVEMCSLKDLENASKLLAAFIKNIGPRTDFRPS